MRRVLLLLSCVVGVGALSGPAVAADLDPALYPRLRTLAAQQLKAGRPVIATDILLQAGMFPASKTDATWDRDLKAAAKVAATQLSTPIAFTFDPDAAAAFERAVPVARKTIDTSRVHRLVRPEDAAFVLHWSFDGPVTSSRREDGKKDFRWYLPNRNHYLLAAQVATDVYEQKVRSQMRQGDKVLETITRKAIIEIVEVKHPRPADQVKNLERPWGEHGLTAHRYQFPAKDEVIENHRYLRLAAILEQGAKAVSRWEAKVLREEAQKTTDPLARYDLELRAHYKAPTSDGVNDSRRFLYEHLGITRMDMLGDGSANRDRLDSTFGTGLYFFRADTMKQDAERAEREGSVYAAWLARVLLAQRSPVEERKARADERKRVMMLLPKAPPLPIEVRIKGDSPAFPALVKEFERIVEMTPTIDTVDAAPTKFILAASRLDMAEPVTTTTFIDHPHERGTTANPDYKTQAAAFKKLEEEQKRLEHIALVTGCSLNGGDSERICTALGERHLLVKGAAGNAALGMVKLQKAFPVPAKSHHVVGALDVEIAGATTATVSMTMDESFVAWEGKEEIGLKARVLNVNRQSATSELGLRAAREVYRQIAPVASAAMPLPADRDGLAHLDVLVRRAVTMRDVRAWADVESEVTRRWYAVLDVAEAMKSIGQVPTAPTPSR